MKEIGGYFGLEPGVGEEFHDSALKFNSGRNALNYLLSAQPARKIHLPYYICDTVLEPLRDLGVEHAFYHVDRNMELTHEIKMQDDEKILYVNYFGLKRVYCEQLVRTYGDHLILDYAQAFFERPFDGIDTYYSPRKFFGVCDGGYLYSQIPFSGDLPRGSSSAGFEYLAGRVDVSAKAFYGKYRENEQHLGSMPVEGMSRSTRTVLASADYGKAESSRRQNFSYLHEQLRASNELAIELVDGAVPMVYPYLSRRQGLRDALLVEKIYVATYWEDVLQHAGCGEVEKYFVRNLIPLPVDQRLDADDMDRILAVIRDYK